MSRVALNASCSSSRAKPVRKAVKMAGRVVSVGYGPESRCVGRRAAVQPLFCRPPASSLPRPAPRRSRAAPLFRKPLGTASSRPRLSPARRSSPRACALWSWPGRGAIRSGARRRAPTCPRGGAARLRSSESAKAPGSRPTCPPRQSWRGGHVGLVFGERWQVVEFIHDEQGASALDFSEV